MARSEQASAGLARLVDGLLAPGTDDALATELASWLAGSARFRTFAETYRDKIRKKLRGAVDAEARRDVRAELAVARLVLADRALTLAFEAYGAQKLGPDFTVTMGGGPGVNLEVTRMRRAPTESAIAGLLLAKLRQLPPSAPNILLGAIDGPVEADIATVVRGLRARADTKDETYFADRGVAGTRGFYDRFLRLGAVIVWTEATRGDTRATVWVNGSARIAVPDRPLRAIVRCLRDDG